MQSTATEHETILPDNALDRAAVREQMERILASPHFCHSRRYPVLFRYVVEKTLQGERNALKERTVGIDAFGREPDYDTNLDPIVRVTAGEVRKRIAQYYHEDGREDELRIDLPAGSYVPVFVLHTEAPDSLDTVETTLPAVELEPATIAPSAPPRRSPIPMRGFISIFVLLATGVFAVWLYRTQMSSPTLETVWQPFLDANVPVVISIGEPSLVPVNESSEPSTQPTVAEHLRQVDYLAFSDVQALSRLTGLLDRRRHAYRLQPASATTFADLREGASILIGGFDNPWTLRALANAPFGFGRTSEGFCWIVDRRTPELRRWSVDFRQPYAQLTNDYAIVARLNAPDTHQPVLVIAGVGENGTKAAAEFVTDPESLRAAFGGRQASGKNIEIVLATEVVNGVSGPPRILAQQIW